MIGVGSIQLQVDLLVHSGLTQLMEVLADLAWLHLDVSFLGENITRKVEYLMEFWRQVCLVSSLRKRKQMSCPVCSSEALTAQRCFIYHMGLCNLNNLLPTENSKDGKQFTILFYFLLTLRSKTTFWNLFISICI